MNLQRLNRVACELKDMNEFDRTARKIVGQFGANVHGISLSGCGQRLGYVAVLRISSLLPWTDSFLATVMLTVIVNRGIIRETLSRLFRVLRPLSS
jgi:hypothetical protein